MSDTCSICGEKFVDEKNKDTAGEGEWYHLSCDNEIYHQAVIKSKDDKTAKEDGSFSVPEVLLERHWTRLKAYVSGKRTFAEATDGFGRIEL